jgi:hypothetical protein
MRWVGYIARKGETLNEYTFWSRNLKERCHLEDFAVDERIILKWILKEYDRRVRTGFICLRISISDGLL